MSTWRIKRFESFSDAPVRCLGLRMEYSAMKPSAWWPENIYDALGFSDRRSAEMVARLYPEMCVACEIVDTEAAKEEGKP